MVDAVEGASILLSQSRNVSPKRLQHLGLHLQYLRLVELIPLAIAVVECASIGSILIDDSPLHLPNWPFLHYYIVRFKSVK